MERASRARRDEGRGEDGFTVVEMVVAMTLLAGALMALAHLLFGSMSALDAVRQRSVYLEIANGQMEALRALPYDDLGVRADDPDMASAYPGGSYDGKDAVVVTTATTPDAVESFAGGTKAAPVPYTVRRYVTWSGVNGTAGTDVKRITVIVEWEENNEATRSIRLVSSRYPGDRGEVTAENTAPVAVLAASTDDATAGVTTVTFNGTGSTDDDGDTLTYTWQFGDGSAAVSGVSAWHVFNVPGTYTVQLTVTDGHGGFDIDSTTVDVSAIDGNLPPSAVCATSDTSGVAPFSVNFDGSGSTDPNNDPLSYEWEWGDGEDDGSGVNATHEYTAAGTFYAVLTVSDPAGLESTCEVPVTIAPLNCDVIDGYFRNPASSTNSNEIRVLGNDRPKETGFLFRATTNEACDSLSVHLPYAGGVWVVDLALVADTGTLRTWQSSTTWTSTAGFATGAAQTGELWSPSTTGADERFPFSFTVHR